MTARSRARSTSGPVCSGRCCPAGGCWYCWTTRATRSRCGHCWRPAGDARRSSPAGGALSGLESTRWLWLDPLTTAGAVDLVTLIADPDRVRAEPEAAAELVELCGNLPLAVRIAGNRLARQPSW